MVASSSVEKKQNTSRRFMGGGWLLAGSCAFLLAALWLWSEKLAPGPNPARHDKQEGRPRVDGTPVAGEPQPLAYAGESCRPWNVSAAAEPPAAEVPLVFITSRLSDPYGLILSGFAAECGPPRAVLAVENTENGELARQVEEKKPAALIAVGMASVQLAEREANRLPLLYAAVPNPGAAGLDRPGAAGVSPWIPPEPMLRHLLGILPARARLGLFRPAGRLQEMAGAVARLARSQERTVNNYTVAGEAGLEELLSRAALETDAWIVLCDRSRDHSDLFERILVRAETAKLPLAVSDEDHVRQGALVGVGTDSHRIGQQLCRLAGAMLRGQLPAGGRILCPEYTFAVVHQTRAEKLGYLIDPLQTPQLKVYKWH